MTREETIKHLKLMQSGARNAIRFIKNDKEISEEERKEDIEIYQDQLEALNVATNVLEQEPCEGKLAIERYQDLVDFFGDEDIAKEILEDREEFKKWLDRMKWHVRKADEFARKLNQEPCEDAVSRQAVITVIKDWWEKGVIAIDDIRKLSSVTPTHKKGKWEKGYSFPDGEYVKCTVCGEIIKCIYPMHYCPNCGAEMRGEE